MTAEEKMRRALAVENMHRLYKKYYPLWVEKNNQEVNTSGTYREAEENSASILFCLFHSFLCCDTIEQTHRRCEK